MFKKVCYKKIKKDYQLKNLANPFLRKKNIDKKRRLEKMLLPLFFLIVVFLIWFFLAAPFWQIKKIQLKGLTRVPVSTIEELIWEESQKTRWLIFPASHIFFFDAQTAAARIMSDHNLSSCVIKKRFPNTIEVLGQERPYAFIWQEGSESYYASDDAYIIRGQSVSEEDMSKYFILENKNPRSLISSQNRLNIKPEYLEFTKSLNSFLDNEEELTLDRFILDWEFNTLKAKFVDGPLVYFNIQDKADEQLNRFLLVKNEKIKDNFSRTDYIDLRYGDRIFINPDFK